MDFIVINQTIKDFYFSVLVRNEMLTCHINFKVIDFCNYYLNHKFLDALLKQYSIFANAQQ